VCGRNVGTVLRCTSYLSVLTVAMVAVADKVSHRQGHTIGASHRAQSSLEDSGELEKSQSVVEYAG
jgi:hypothetical protein